jgi:hypothetical protein
MNALDSQLPECSSDLVLQWLEDILQRGAIVGLDEHFRLHPGQEPDTTESVDFM